MTSNEPDSSRLLSVQSHVVSGFVGNRSATFPLQLLGYDVDVINTVQFSNHTGYGRWGGVRFDETQIKDLFEGLRKNGLSRYSRMLSGYMPSPRVVSCVKDAVSQLRELNPQLIYMLDPVMGDIGRGMYVNPEVLPIYRSMLPLASVITPNQFEAQVLAEQEITSLDSLFSVLRILHTRYGAPHVLITSVSLPSSDLESVGISGHSKEDGSPLMLLVGSSYSPAAKAQELGRSKGSQPSTPSLESNFQFNFNQPSRNLNDRSNGNPNELFKPWFIQFPEVEGYFSGVGDTFAALTLGRFHPEKDDQTFLDGSPSPIARAAELSIASLQGILKNTTDYIAKSDPIPTSDELKRQINDELLRFENHSEGVLPDKVEFRRNPSDPPYQHELRNAVWDLLSKKSQGLDCKQAGLDENETSEIIQAHLKVESMRRRELRMIQSRVEIENPLVRYRARWLEIVKK